MSSSSASAENETAAVDSTKDNNKTQAKNQETPKNEATANVSDKGETAR